MKKVWNEMLKSAIIGVCTAMVIFCMTGVIFDFVLGGNFSLTNYAFTKMVVGCLIVGLGFGMPSVIYHSEKLPIVTKIFVHMGIGCMVFTITAFHVGWTGEISGFVNRLVLIAMQIAIAFAIWLFFMIHYKNEARKLNDKLQKIKK